MDRSQAVTGDRADTADIEDNDEPDLDVVVGVANAGRDSDANSSPSVASRRVQEAWVTVDGKKVHKATVLQLYSNPMAVKDSKDRLKRVRGFSQYQEIPLTTNSFVPDSENPNTVHVQDPALTLVKCNKQIFLAVFQILSIRINGKAVLSPVTVPLMHDIQSIAQHVPCIHKGNCPTVWATAQHHFQRQSCYISCYILGKCLDETIKTPRHTFFVLFTCHLPRHVAGIDGILGFRRQYDSLSRD